MAAAQIASVLGTILKVQNDEQKIFFEGKQYLQLILRSHNTFQPHGQNVLGGG